MPIGPQLPPHLARSTTPEDAKNATEDDADDFVPALPPHLAAKRAQAPKSRDVGPQRPGPSVGPSVGPSAGPSIGPSAGPSASPSVGPRVGPSVGPGPYPDSDSDDEVGPKPDSAPVKQQSAADAFREREARWARERESGANSSSSKPQRAEWMLVPPSAGVLGGVLDPTKRPTSFAKTSREGVSAADQRVWTETPAEKARRLQEEVAGVKRGRDEHDEYEERRRRRDRDEAVRREVEAHNKSSRGGSLLSQHQKRKAESKDEEDEPAFWDHSKHMGITGRLLSSEERAQKIKDARNLSDRFGHGKGGAYAP